MDINFLYVTRDKKHSIEIICDDYIINYKDKFVALYRHHKVCALIPFNKINCFEIYANKEMIDNYYRG